MVTELFLIFVCILPESNMLNTRISFFSVHSSVLLVPR